jgi:DNA-directed RNA polymerase subunit RPC12/RpoP
MVEPPPPNVAYFECPRCGARYLERDQRGASPLNGEPRWFSCHRCKKRVRSADSPERDTVGAPSP